MLEYVVKQTDEFVSSKPKDVRKSFGQFFTPKATACYMAGLLCVPRKEAVRILDPGAGSGILSATILEVIDKHHPDVKEAHLTIRKKIHSKRRTSSLAMRGIPCQPLSGICEDKHAE